MAAHILKPLYARARKLLEPAISLRNAVAAKDAKLVKSLSAGLLELLRPWDDEIKAAEGFKKNQEEWFFTHAQWRHRESDYSEPARPEWPALIPEYDQAIGWIREIGNLQYAVGLYQNPKFDGLEPHPFAHYLTGVIRDLDEMQQAIEDAESDAKATKSDGPIDRDRLAQLLGISTKTLANRARDLPAPISRVGKDVPVYSYQRVRAALVTIYPNKEFMLPEEYSDAMSHQA